MASISARHFLCFIQIRPILIRPIVKAVQIHFEICVRRACFTLSSLQGGSMYKRTQAKTPTRE
jgi:hypothetical protein